MLINDEMTDRYLYYITARFWQYMIKIENFNGLLRMPFGYDPFLNFDQNHSTNKLLRIQTAYDQCILKKFAQACEKN